jgi:branched-chain amino acid transport system permease protein
MLNLAHSGFLAAGAYGSLLLVERLGFPWWAGIAGGALGGALMGLISYLCLVRWVFARPNFEINIIILTMALSMLIVDMINNLIGPTTSRQPFNLDGRIDLGGAGITSQTILIICGCAIMVAFLQVTIKHTGLGRAIRAVAQEPTAAQLNGVPINTVVLKVLLLAGCIAGASGVLLTAFTTVYPTVGLDPLLKALIICVVAGLGNIPAALTTSFLLAFVEVLVQYTFGTKWGFPALLSIVVAVLIVRPNGLFGQKLQMRN